MSKPRLIFCSLCLALGAALVLVATSLAGSGAKAAPFKAAWIYVGPHNDGGWSQAHDAARLYVQKTLGSKVQTTFKENVPEGPQVAQVIESLIRHANAFVLGAQATHPGAKVKLLWTNSWFAPDKEKKAAESLASAGADVLAQNVDSPATGQFAQSKGIPWVGYDSDAKKFAPTSWLTAPIYNWGPYYLSRVKAAMNGTWKTGFYYGNLKDHFVGIAPYGPKVTAATKAAIAKKKAALVSGKFYEFKGPLYDQSGKLRVPAGKSLTVNELYTMNWLVKGVVGSAKG